MSRVVANAFTVMACGVLWTSAAMAAESHSTAADGGVAQVQDAGSASVSMSAAATAVADGAVSPRNLQDEIAELRAKMAEMESRHQNEMASLRAEYGDRWLTEQRAEEIRELVRD
ncbi:MAG: hypothetical protein ACO32I_09535, partial [Candidatus Limnocylindrus sp.]